MAASPHERAPFFGLSVPFTSGKSERRLAIEQYSGEGCSATRPRTLTGVWGVSFFGVATVAVHSLVPPMSVMSISRQPCLPALRVRFSQASRSGVVHVLGVFKCNMGAKQFIEHFSGFGLRTL